MTDRLPFIGDRVVVRYRLGNRTPADWRGNPTATLSDVTGLLVDDGDPLVVDRDGTREAVPRTAISSIRILSRVTVRNSQIRALEGAAAAAWPGVESTIVAGWLLRSGRGFTRRANSAIPLEFGARADAATLGEIRAWYRERGLPMLVALPDRLVPAGQITGRPVSGEIDVLVRDVDGFPAAADPAVGLATAPTPAWLRAYRGPEVDVDTATAVVSASRGPVTFAAVEDDTAELGGPRSIGRGSVTAAEDGTRWLGLTAIWTHPARRRSGLAGAVLSTLVAWGIDEGAERIYVQVEGDNRVAGNWYRALGFGLHHTARYLEIG